MTIGQASIVQAEQIKHFSSLCERDSKDSKHGNFDDIGDRDSDSKGLSFSSSSISPFAPTNMIAEEKGNSPDATSPMGNVDTLISNNTSNFPSIANISSITKIRKHLIDLQDNRGRTPLYISAAWGFKELVAGFIRNNADITKQDVMGLSPILVAKREIESLMQKVSTYLPTYLPTHVHIYLLSSFSSYYKLLVIFRLL